MAPMAAEVEQKTEDMPSGGMQQTGAIREEEVALLRCHMAACPASRSVRYVHTLGQGYVRALSYIG